jgi:structure-specific endonuclease subunit SLX1
LCLTDRLANLHLLLRARSFERWPLKVTFYAEDVYRVWTRWIGQHLELQGGNGLREGIWVGMDESMASKAAAAATTTADETAPDAVKGIHALEVTHAPLKPHIEKSQALLATPENCTLCSSPLPLSGASTLTCPSSSCTSKAHLTCLATHFLNTEKSSNATNITPSLLPTTGSCPTCHTPLQWRDLVQELSLRMRGSKELEVLFKQPKTRKTRKNTTAGAAAVEEEEDEEEEEEEEDPEAANFEPELDDEDDDVGDGWHQLSESESELESLAEPVIAVARPVASSSKKTAPSFRMPKESASTRAGAKEKGSAKKRTALSKGPEVMIEDSDSGDDVEIIA